MTSSPPSDLHSGLLVENVVCHAAVLLLQRHMHSYREAFEELDGGSPTPTVGGEAFPQTPAFPISPQTPYFNLCKFSLWLTEGFVEFTKKT